MAKPVEDHGHAVAVSKPLRLHIREPGKLPDPTQCAGCMILINDRHDGNPRPVLAISNGASWDRYRLVADEPARAVAFPPAPHDLMPMVHEAVLQALPTMMPAPEVRMIPSQPQAPVDVAPLAHGILELSQHVERLDEELAATKAQLRFVVENAVGKVTLETAA